MVWFTDGARKAMFYTIVCDTQDFLGLVVLKMLLQVSGNYRVPKWVLSRQTRTETIILLLA